MQQEVIERAKEHFEKVILEQLERIERMKKDVDWIDYSKVKPIIIGVVGGDGIGPYICRHAQTVLEFLLKEEMENGKVEFRTIEGLTIENRAKVGKAIPDDVLEELKSCHVILKGPTTTPQAGDAWPQTRRARSGRIQACRLSPGAGGALPSRAGRNRARRPAHQGRR